MSKSMPRNTSKSRQLPTCSMYVFLWKQVNTKSAHRPHGLIGRLLGAYCVFSIRLEVRFRGCAHEVSKLSLPSCIGRVLGRLFPFCPLLRSLSIHEHLLFNMSDPLSVAASIAGLVSLAGQLYNVLDTFISGVRDAPSMARTVHAELNACRTLLVALQGLLSGPAFSHSRATLIPAHSVIVSFTDAVLLFSELEATILPLAGLRTTTFVARARWARKEPRLTVLTSRLQWHKSTLVLQLNILQWYVESHPTNWMRG